jgi:hypothetical protein
MKRRGLSWPIATVFLVLSQRLDAAFAAVQASAEATGTTSNLTVPITVVSTGSGNLVVAMVRLSNTTDTCSGVSDNVGNTYALLGPFDSGSNPRVYMAYGVQTTGGATTVTAATPGGTASKRCFAVEFSGNASSNAAAFDTYTTGSGTTETSLSVSTLTPAASGELIVAFVSTQSSATGKSWTAGSGYTLYGGGSGNQTVRGEYKLSSGSSETAPITLNAAGTSWVEVAAAFIPAGAPTPTPTPTPSQGSFFLLVASHAFVVLQ